MKNRGQGKNRSYIKGTFLKWTVLTAYCVSLGNTGACYAEVNETKGLFREPATNASSLQMEKADEKTNAEGVTLQGNVTRHFPSPDDVFEVEPAKKDDSSRSKLDAIITKSGDDTQFDRLMKQGNTALLQGYLKKADENYTKAIQELKKTGIHDLRLAKARNAAANALLRQGNVLDAKQTFELAMKTATENPSNDVELSKAMSGLGGVAKANGDYRKAEQYFKDAAKTRRKMTGDDDSGMAQILLDLGETYRAQKLYEAGEPVYQLALETLNKSKDVPDLTKAYFLDKTGMFFHDQAKIPEAKKLFSMALEIKDKYSTLYTPTNGRERGLVYYRCENGVPNAARVYNRNAEIEYLQIKDAVTVATLTPQVYADDWYLLKAEVTIQNQGKTAITACGELPSLTLETPKRKVLSPLDSEAIASQLGMRGRLLYSRLLHSADFAYNVNSFNIGSTTTAGYTPFGTSLFNTVGTWTTITPDWGARAAARNAAINALGSAMDEGSTVFSTKPSPLTIAPGESATFQIFFPYDKFDNCTLRFLVGNAVMEFPFTNKSG